jgi:hypothetical protein
MKVPFNNRIKHTRKTMVNSNKKKKVEHEEAVFIENNLDEEVWYDSDE